jgi:hypothetical protein
MNSFNEFLSWEMSTKDTVDFKKVYVDIADDLVAGLVLSQIVYWYLPNKKGVNKLRINKGGHTWIAKAHSDWYEEIRVTEYQAPRALKILEDKGIIEKRIWKFNGAPTIHIRIVEENFLSAISKLVNVQNGNEGKTRMETGERNESLTETTTETTKEITKDLVFTNVNTVETNVSTEMVFEPDNSIQGFEDFEDGHANDSNFDVSNQIRTMIANTALKLKNPNHLTRAPVVGLSDQSRQLNIRSSKSSEHQRFYKELCKLTNQNPEEHSGKLHGISKKLLNCGYNLEDLEDFQYYWRKGPLYEREKRAPTPGEVYIEIYRSRKMFHPKQESENYEGF